MNHPICTHTKFREHRVSSFSSFYRVYIIYIYLLTCLSHTHLRNQRTCLYFALYSLTSFVPGTFRVPFSAP